MSAKLFNNVCETVGRTPIIRINRLAPEGVNLYVKCESFNPMSSVKDRLALALIEDAEKRGTLKPGQTVVEATSGNTGIALAMVCAAKGYPCVMVMADSFSEERRVLMRALGAKVVLTPKELKGTGMLVKAKQLAEENGWFYAQQFSNRANPEYHANTTGPEILDSFRGQPLDYFVSGWGTGGTISGAGRVLKAARSNIRIIAAEPTDASMLQGQPWRPHPIQGWAPDFIPEVLDKTVIDGYQSVTGPEAVNAAKQLAQKEGILCGISSGATFAAALKVAATVPEGSTILCMLPDTGERYFSTILFSDVNRGTDEV